MDPVNNQSFGDLQKIVVPTDEYFVVGDNRDNSSDSRIWGTVRRELIEAKYYLTYISSK